jgi:hypothetical protein
MEETIGECTNLHITYPALVLGYFAVIRANRTVKDAFDAPNVGTEDNTENDAIEPTSSATNVSMQSLELLEPEKVAEIKANDIAIREDNSVTDGIRRFHSALSEMSNRRGIRNEISRYESIAFVLVEPKGEQSGSVVTSFPLLESPLHLSKFFSTLYRRYDERFILGAPLLADRRITSRFEWASNSPVFARSTLSAATWPNFEFEARISST